MAAPRDSNAPERSACGRSGRRMRRCIRADTCSMSCTLPHHRSARQDQKDHRRQQVVRMCRLRAHPDEVRQLSLAQMPMSHGPSAAIAPISETPPFLAPAAPVQCVLVYGACDTPVPALSAAPFAVVNLKHCSEARFVLL
ncbi:hypothetical protein GGI05_002012 [Coemansia sp. RSA 2603]|nr:hypothetical protein GGI05_002012 [Coemansia sp. RSA 2603]